MIDVPPPTRTSKPFVPSSRVLEMKAMSWMPVSARSTPGDPSKAVLILRGISCVVGCRTKSRT